MQIGTNRLVLFFAVMLLTVSQLSAVQMGRAAASEGIPSHPANAVWIDPSTINISSASIGYRFNVTIMANLSVPSFVWQVNLNFNPARLRAIGANYTGEGTSRFFAGHATIPVKPAISNAEGQVLYGEALIGSDARPAGSDSLCSIEFQVVSQISQTELNIDNKDTFVLNNSVSEIPCAKHDAIISGKPGNRLYIIGIDPWQVNPGTSVSVYGAAATPMGLVSALIHGPIDQNSSDESGNLTLGTAYASESGNWEINFTTTPDLPPGYYTYDVYVVDNDSLNSDSIPLHVEIIEAVNLTNQPITGYPHNGILKNVTVPIIKIYPYNGTLPNGIIMPQGPPPPWYSLLHLGIVNFTTPPVFAFPNGLDAILNFSRLWIPNTTLRNGSPTTTAAAMTGVLSPSLIVAFMAGVLVSGIATLLFLVSITARKNNPRRKR